MTKDEVSSGRLHPVTTSGFETVERQVAREVTEPFRAGDLQPWLAGYALVGLVASGIVPVLLPLTVDPKGAVAVGLVVAGFYLGTVFAPVVGSLADLTGAHRLIFLGSFPAAAAGAILFGLSSQTWEMFVCIFAVGAAAGAAQTTASMFIVEGRPRTEWPERIGWMRLTFGLGQVLGLAVSAYFAHRLETGWIVVGIVMVIGCGLGALRLPHLAAPDKPAPAADAPRSAALDGLKAIIVSRFGVFLGCWLFAMLGLMTFYNVVPLVLRNTFGITPSTTSLVFLAGSVVGAVLYPVCGKVSRRLGAARVLSIGIGATLVSFLVLALATLAHDSIGAVLGAACLVVIAVFYPFQYIGATLLAAEIAPGGQGAALGLFNSCVALGAIIGALVPSVLARNLGYGSLAWFSLGAMIVSVIFGRFLLQSLHRSPVDGA